jgi:hypothetical protein
VDPESSLVTSYPRHARYQAKVRSGDSVNWAPELEASPFADASIRVELELGPDQSAWGHSIYVRSSTGGGGALGSSDNASDAHLLVPDLPDVTFDVGTHASSSEGTSVNWVRGLLPGDHARSTAIEAPNSLLPLDDTEPECPGEFAWSTVPGAIYYVLLHPGPDGGGYTYELATSEPHASLPDVRALGVPAPAGDYEWWPNSVGGPDSLDSYASNGQREGWGLGHTRACHYAAAAEFERSSLPRSE